MKHKFYLFIFAAAVIFLLGNFQQIQACSCLEERPVCESFGDAKSVFVGEVVVGKSAERLSDSIKMGGSNPFVFKVKEAFLGAKVDKEIEIFTGSGFGDCGFPFQKGETYLVYAYENKQTGKLTTGICTRSARISEVEEEDFTFLKSLKKNPSGARLFGKVDLYAKSSFEKESIQPMKNFEISVEQLNDRRKKYQIFTDKSGEYEIINLPAGKYKITPSIPKNLTTDDFDEDAEIEINDKGCFKQDFRLENDSLVFVKVIDSDGNPVKNIWVELIPAEIEPLKDRAEFDFHDEFGVTNPQGGLYNFHVPPGRYTVSVNYWHLPDKDHPFATTFYPGTSDRTKAGILEIKRGSQIRDVVIQLPPPLKTKKINGKAFWKSGEPVDEASIYLRDSETGRNYAFSRTDYLGNFSFEGLIGQKYLLVLTKEKETDEKTVKFEGENVEFVLDENTGELKMFLENEFKDQ